MSFLRASNGLWCVVVLAACFGPVSTAWGGVITFGSDTSWNVSQASNPIGNAQYVALSEVFPTRRPPTQQFTQFTTGGVGWFADLSTIPDAYWIWAPGITPDTTNPAYDQYSFSKQFDLAGPPVTGTISIAVDDYAAVYVNGYFVGEIGSVSDSSAAFAAQSALTTFDLTPFLVLGQNTITVYAENGPLGDTTNYRGDPAGVVFGGSLEAVPEPSSLALLGSGCCLLSLWCARIRRRAAIRMQAFGG